MDKNNRKLKILYKCIMANTSAIWQRTLHVSPTEVPISYTLKNKTKTKSHTKEPTFRKLQVQGKRGQENGPKARKGKTEKATGLGRRTREVI